MRLSKRDKTIMSDLQRFRVMNRDHIAELHFSNLKNPINAANNVLKRLHRDRLIDRISTTPFCYLPNNSKMKKTSQKIPHFLEIVKTYIDMCRIEKPEIFLVEPKYGNKGTVEPDVFCIWKRTPIFIEVQNSQYSQDVMQKKLERYVLMYENGLLDNETWQPAKRTVFPHILILSNTRYALDGSYPFKVLQAQNINQFLSSINKKEKQQQERQREMNDEMDHETQRMIQQNSINQVKTSSNLRLKY